MDIKVISSFLSVSIVFTNSPLFPFPFLSFLSPSFVLIPPFFSHEIYNYYQLLLLLLFVENIHVPQPQGYFTFDRDRQEEPQLFNEVTQEFEGRIVPACGVHATDYDDYVCK